VHFAANDRQNVDGCAAALALCRLQPAGRAGLLCALCAVVQSHVFAAWEVFRCQVLPNETGLYAHGWLIQHTSVLTHRVPLRRDYLAQYVGMWPGVTHLDGLLVRTSNGASRLLIQ
jgi:hypothetical protein